MRTGFLAFQGATHLRSVGCGFLEPEIGPRRATGQRALAGRGAGLKRASAGSGPAQETLEPHAGTTGSCRASCPFSGCPVTQLEPGNLPGRQWELKGPQGSRVVVTLFLRAQEKCVASKDGPPHCHGIQLLAGDGHLRRPDPSRSQRPSDASALPAKPRLPGLTDAANPQTQMRGSGD